MKTFDDIIFENLNYYEIIVIRDFSKLSTIISLKTTIYKCFAQFKIQNCYSMKHNFHQSIN